MTRRDRKIRSGTPVIVSIALIGAWAWGAQNLAVAQEVKPKEEANLLKLIDPDLDAIAGAWAMSEGVLKSPPVPVARLQIPFLPPEEYDLRVVAELKGPPESLNLGLPVGGKRVHAILGGWNGTASGLHRIDGKDANENETTVRGPVFVQDQPRTILCSIRKDRVRISVDGQPVIDWKPDYGRLSEDPGWAVRDDGTLFVGSFATSFDIRKLDLVPVSGAGKFYRPVRRESRTIGGVDGTAFEDFAPPESILVGLRVTWDYFLSKPLRNGDIVIVKTIQPLFQGKKGAVAGDIHGAPVARDCWSIVAKPGYAVGGIVAKGAAGVDGLKAVFFRIGVAGLDRKDRYESDWYGGKGGGPETLLGGDGRPVLGIRGTAEEDLIGFGLVQGEVPSGILQALRDLPPAASAVSSFPPGKGTRRMPFLSEYSAPLVGALTFFGFIVLVVLVVSLRDNSERRVWVGTLGGATVALGVTTWGVLQTGDVRGAEDFFLRATLCYLGIGVVGVLFGAILARAGIVPILLGSAMALGMGVALAVLGYVVGISFGGPKDFGSLYSLLIGEISLFVGIPLSMSVFIPLRHRASASKGTARKTGPAAPRGLPGKPRPLDSK